MSKKTKDNLDFSIIEQACNGDENAMQKVLKYYDSYISKLCIQPSYDLNGQAHMVVDQEMKGRLQTSLLTGILKFDTASIA